MLTTPQSISSKSNSRCKRLPSTDNLITIFILMSLLVVASIRCDHVGSKNDSSRSTKSQLIDPTASIAELDPLNLLREIYMDRNSKLVSSSYGDSVQKFHPNGRYGRRSVNNFGDSSSQHSEFGQLVSTNERPTGNLLQDVLFGLHEASLSGSYKPNELISNEASTLDSAGGNLAGSTNMQLEIRKLLKCNYAGVSNLYRCNIGKTAP